MRAHAKDFFAVSRFPESLRFETRTDGHEHCGYCGSISVARAIALLETPGAEYSGSDWKYGWPHKFYLGAHEKFYAEHLLDAPAEQLAQFSELASKLLGIRYELDEQGLKFRAVHRGFQTWGVVGGPRKDGAPEVPSDWWKV